MLHTATAADLDGSWHRNGPAMPGFDFFASGGKMVRWEHGKPVEKTVTKRGHHFSKSGCTAWAPLADILKPIPSLQ